MQSMGIIMKMYVISDNVDTRTGMRLAGIEGCVAHGEAEVRAALDRALADKEIAVVLLTQKAQQDAAQYVAEVKLAHSRPLIVSIPDRHGLDKNQNAIMDYIKDAIGLKL